MYAGQVMEQGTNHELLIDPRHEYTRGLLGSVLSIEAGAERLHQVPGTVPSPRDFAVGDRFAPRSLDPSADPTTRPRLVATGAADHLVSTTGEVPASLEGDPR
jgi:peptide/nickel transport system permease protein